MGWKDTTRCAAIAEEIRRMEERKQKREPVVNISACAWYGTLAKGVEQLMCRCMDAGMPKEAAYDVTVDVLKRAAACALKQEGKPTSLQKV